MTDTMTPDRLLELAAQAQQPPHQPGRVPLACRATITINGG